MQQQHEGRAYDWDEQIDNPNEGGGEYVLLNKGKYPFKVVKFERGQFNGGDKTPACKKAIVHLEVDGGDQGTTTVKDDLILHSNFEWKLCQFFKSIGDRKSGEPLKMNWQTIIGKRGWLEISHRQGTGQYADKVYNEVKKYIDPADAPASQPQQSSMDSGGFDWADGQQQPAAVASSNDW